MDGTEACQKSGDREVACERLDCVMRQGALLVTLKCANNLAAKDDGHTSDPFAKLKFNDIQKTTATIFKTLDPVYNAKFEWLNVRALPSPSVCLPVPMPKPC
jgi:Ca2+-dependent lipid-binding protein